MVGATFAARASDLRSHVSRYHLRRTDRELTDPDALDDVLRRGSYVTVGLVQDGAPYVVSLSYGFDEARCALYSHLATEGRKLDAITADPRVCATVVIDGGYRMGECKHDYESVVIEGRMVIVDDPAERRHGMRVLVGRLERDVTPLWEKHGLEGDEPYTRMRIARLDIEAITGKAGS
jgi:nitroimidazol reductase NimA-like FMN-containing flavoprotein (pyridoxamine 5'-phosphate oxidase superfamily)